VLNDDLRQKSIVIDRYEAELKRFRSEAFLDRRHQGVRSYPQERVEVLKARGSVDNYRLLESSRIDPNESALVMFGLLLLRRFLDYEFTIFGNVNFDFLQNSALLK